MSIFPICIDDEKSSFSYVHDKNTDTKFLDMHSHFSSLPLGYNHPVFSSAGFRADMTRAGKFKPSFCAYDHPAKELFESEFAHFRPLGWKFAHYACTGALAVEAAIKTSWHHHDYKRKKVISLVNSFHGVNSYGSFLSSTDRVAGVPETPWAIKLDINGDWQTYIKREKDSIAAIIVEPIQCTFGDYYISRDKLKAIRELCTWCGIVLIFDEIQTGLSTNTTWYFQQLNFQPDIVVFGKKFQVSGILVKPGYDKIENDIMRLSVTFDGDACDMVRSAYILKEIRQANLLMHLQSITDTLIVSLKYAFPMVLNLRGQGALIAFDLETRELRDAFVNKAFEYRLLVNSTGKNTIRLRPNLVFSLDDVRRFLDIMSYIMIDLNLRDRVNPLNITTNDLLLKSLKRHTEEQSGTQFTA